ncbi:MAG: hypothetical protein VB051_08515 [Candidatus Pelethousia sp.]|nr:hypothetical protein [Candidatus Pelethousia sp.]
MEAKKVLICCANGVATSTMLSMKCKAKFKELGIPAEVRTCTLNEVAAKAQSFKPNIIISNVGTGIRVPEGIPVVYGVNLLSGRGAEETWQSIINILTEEK